jgi:hypothetical protein
VTADIRNREQCGTSFVPRREHARCCSARRRDTWNREHRGDLTAGDSALQWAVTAMSDTADRLPQVRARDLARAAAVIGESVWWITIVDAALVCHHLGTYDHVLAAQAPARRQLIEGTLTGLRFVRNRIGGQAGLAEFIEPGDSAAAAGAGHITDWTWKPVPQPAVASLPPRGQAWEMLRYRAYQAHLADRTIGEIFGRAAAFLKLAATAAPSAADTSMHAAR